MLSNKYLIATDKVKNKFLQNKLIYIIKHGLKGAEGIIVNPDVIGEVKVFDLSLPLYLGGISPTGGVYFMHAYESCFYKDAEIFSENCGKQVIDVLESLYIADDIFFGGNSSLQKILDENLGDKYRFYTGQLRWDAWKLENEIKNGYWEISEKDVVDVFFDNKKSEEFYKKVRWLDKPRHNWLFDPPPFFDPRLN
jgi:putative AlgH/UPF0301 family transcriptional regulator